MPVFAICQKSVLSRQEYLIQFPADPAYAYWRYNLGIVLPDFGDIFSATLCRFNFSHT